METMRNLHRLRPCRGCPVRLAVPGSVLCTMCDATLHQQVPADASALTDPARQT